MLQSNQLGTWENYEEREMYKSLMAWSGYRSEAHGWQVEEINVEGYKGLHLHHACDGTDMNVAVSLENGFIHVPDKRKRKKHRSRFYSI